MTKKEKLKLEKCKANAKKKLQKSLKQYQEDMIENELWKDLANIAVEMYNNDPSIPKNEEHAEAFLEEYKIKLKNIVMRSFPII